MKKCSLAHISEGETATAKGHRSGGRRTGDRAFQEAQPARISHKGRGHRDTRRGCPKNKRLEVTDDYDSTCGKSQRR